MTNPYLTVAEFIHEADVDELRQFFLNMLKFQPEAVLHVLNYGDGSWMGEIVAILESGQKINAIKVYRQHTGASLKDSKDAVEAIIAEQFPTWGQ